MESFTGRIYKSSSGETDKIYVSRNTGGKPGASPTLLPILMFWALVSTTAKVKDATITAEVQYGRRHAAGARRMP